MSSDQLKKVLKEGKFFLGQDITLKKLKHGEVKTVFVASNCPESIMSKIKGYEGVDIVVMKENSYDLAMLCKKQFHVNMISS